MNKRAVGAEYEAVAASYLMKQGMVLIYKNFKCRQGEVDLIGLHQNCLVFIEVKYRKNDTSGMPEEAVGLRKQAKICRTSDYFRIRYPKYSQMQVRYDVVALCNENIRWYQNAFPYLKGNAEKDFRVGF
ncbi:MAG: YraN family protein [Lachnospiraceae bacterium]|nr:YraN family protein [Lachnospiraceae bacterium]